MQIREGDHSLQPFWHNFQLKSVSCSMLVPTLIGVFTIYMSRAARCPAIWGPKKFKNVSVRAFACLSCECAPFPATCLLCSKPSVMCILWWHSSYIIGTHHPLLHMPYIRLGNNCLLGFRLGLGSRRTTDSRFRRGYRYTPPLGSPSPWWSVVQTLWVSIVFCVTHNLQPICAQVSLDSLVS